jgi:hypothetical protein
MEMNVTETAPQKKLARKLDIGRILPIIIIEG